jgi:hypothetical protein
MVSAAASLYLLETLLTLWSSLPSVTQAHALQRRVAAAKALGIEFDSRTKTQVVDDLRSRGVDAVLSVFPQALLKSENGGTLQSRIRINGAEVLPLSGIANKLVVVCNEGGQYLTYRSDRHGFNNPQEIWGQAPVDIATLGDSFVQGWCVPQEQSFVGVIRKSRSATLNLGMEGGAPLTMLATLKEYGPIVKPRNVLWFYYEGNDLGDLERERHSPLLRRYLNDGFTQNLRDRQAEIDRALDEHVKAAREENRLVATLKEIAGRIDDLKPAEPARPASDLPPPKRHAVEIELLENILKNAKQFVGGWGGNLYFVYLPAYLRYAPEQDDFFRDYVLQAARGAGLPIIHIHPTFGAHKDPLSLFALRLHSHYTPEGHELVAKQVRDAIAATK